MHGAFVSHRGKASADFHTFDGIHAHHGIRNIGIELVKQRLPQPNRHVGRRHAQPCATGIAAFAQRVHVVFQRADIGQRRKKRVLVHMRPAFKSHWQLAHLRDAAPKLGAVALLEPLFGYCACRHHRRSQPR